VTDAPVVIDDVVHDLDGSTVHVRLGVDAVELRLNALGSVAVETAVEHLTSLVAASVPLTQAATTVQEASSDVPGHTARRRLANGALVLDDTASRTALEVRASLRVLADVTRGRARSFAVLGELESEPADWFDDHDALGRIIVRLDVSQLVVVGHGARHIHNAAGLEGSWDGESILVDTLEQAYDVVRAQVNEGDVVLVSAASRTPLAQLVERLLEADR
jgi:UDP-N-acetylmuramoyl-tripeptide--D-alanyl-D-alanine ligase